MAEGTLEELIINEVASHQGCKIGELFANIDIINACKSTPSLLIDTINKLWEEGELVVIEYVLPTMTYRQKTFLFPKGTKFSPNTLTQFFDTFD